MKPSLEYFTLAAEQGQEAKEAFDRSYGDAADRKAHVLLANAIAALALGQIQLAREAANK